MMKDTYEIVAPFYDALAILYGNGQIDRCRAAMLNKIKPGDKVLFAGVGHGKEAYKAHTLGAQTTVVDTSLAMLKRFHAQFEEEPADVTVIVDDIRCVDHVSVYDYVFANFFLNVFEENEMLEILSHLAKLAKPGSYIVIGDWDFPEGNVIHKILQKVYWYGGLLPFYLLTQNAMHPIYDYASYFNNLGLDIIEKRSFNVGIFRGYMSLLAKSCEDQV